MDTVSDEATIVTQSSGTVLAGSAVAYDENDEKYKYVQSANVLFKFMKRIDYLMEALESKAIFPRYYEEKIDYLNIDKLGEIAIPMSCFCDIHLNKIKHHVSYYGKYGIGLNKNWGIENDIQPIHYLNTHSTLAKSLGSILNSAFSGGKTNQGTISEYKNHILRQLFYVKPLKGNMPIGSNTEYKNFHDEKEWRFIPNFDKVDTELKPLIKNPYINSKSLNNYSAAIKKNENLWLKFNYSDIKYIIVETSSERRTLINFILDKLDILTEEKYKLLSKILVLKEIEEDF